MNSVNIASLPSITAPQALAMTSHCCSYPKATATINLPDLLAAQGEINAEKEATTASWLRRVKVMPDTSQLMALQETLQTLKIMNARQTLIHKKTIISASVSLLWPR